MKAANVDVEPYWPSLFAKALEGIDVKNLITSIGSGAGAASAGGAAAPAAAAEAPAAAESKKEKKEESEEEEDDDMGFGEFQFSIHFAFYFINSFIDLVLMLCSFCVQLQVFSNKQQIILSKAFMFCTVLMCSDIKSF